MPDFEINYNPTWTTTTTGMNLTNEYVQAEPPPPPAFAEANLYRWWQVWYEGNYDQTREAFAEYVKTKVTDPENVVIHWCRRCTMPKPGEGVDIQGSIYCRDCSRGYSCECVDCGDRCLPAATLPNGGRICQSCQDENYTYCDYCGNFYANHEEPHLHRNSACDCLPPTTEIRLRRASSGRIIREDTKIIVDLEEGHISGEGLAEMRVYLINRASLTRRRGEVGWEVYHHLAGDLSVVGTEWQTERGNYPKRLANFAYKHYNKFKLDGEALAEIGNTARAHSKGASVKVGFTRDLNQPRSQFVHEGSCWWTDYNSSRCILKSNGGFGMRTWANGPRRRPTGRAWVLPLSHTLNNGRYHSWRPTFDTLGADGFVIFNGYGDLEEFAPARIMCEVTGLPYKKINFDGGSEDDSEDAMYINNESGYLIARDSLHVDSISLALERHATFTEEREASHG